MRHCAAASRFHHECARLNTFSTTVSVNCCAYCVARLRITILFADGHVDDDDFADDDNVDREPPRTVCAYFFRFSTSTIREHLCVCADY